MGLPLACQFASRGARVIGCDTNERVVSAINRGEVGFDEPGMEALLRSAHACGRLSASGDTEEAVAESEVIVVIIPVLLSGVREAELTGLEQVTRQIARSLRPGGMVCYETTLPVGTTRNRLRPLLENGGLEAGKDFDLVFSPERVKSRLVLKNLTIIPKIVGGVCSESARRAEAFYSEYLGAPVINVGTLEAAELTKLAGMVYRDVNIALANELAAYAEATGVDFCAVIAAANTDGEANLLLPGIGVGGHCTPVYPHFVLQDAKRLGLPMLLTESGRKINEGQPARLFDRLEASGQKLDGATIAILGLGFRPGVKEHTASPAFAIRGEATRRGAKVLLHDPLYTTEELRTLCFECLSLDADTLPSIMVLNTGHSDYMRVDFDSWRARGVRCVIDGRNFWNGAAVLAAGLRYLSPGILTQSKGQ